MVYRERDRGDRDQTDDARQLQDRLERAEEALASLRGEVAQLRRRVQPLTPELLERLTRDDATPAADPRVRHGHLPVRQPL